MNFTLASFPVVALALMLVFSTAYMATRFRIHQSPSIVGIGFLAVLAMHGLSAIPFATGSMGGSLGFDLPVNLEFPWVIGLSFVGYAGGAAFLAYATRFDLIREQTRFFAEPMTSAPMNRAGYWFAVVAGTVVGALYAYGTGQTGLMLVAQEARDETRLRAFRLAFHDANPYYYAGSLVNNVFGPLLLLVAYNEYRQRRTGLWLLTSTLLFGLLVLTSTAGVHKAPIAFACLFVVVNWYFGGNRGKVTNSARFWLIPALVLSGVGVLGYYVTYRVDLGEALDQTFDRIFFIPQYCVNSFLHVYPKIVGFNHGLGIGLIARIAGVEHYESPPFLVANIVSGEENVSSNAFWSTEFWASFGYPGVVAGSLGVGALMLWFDRWCLRRRRTATSVALYAFMVIAVLRMPNASIFTGLLSGGLGLGCLFFVFLEARLVAPRPAPPGNRNVGRAGALGRHRPVASSSGAK